MSEIEIFKHKIQIDKIENKNWKLREWNHNLRNESENSASKI